MTNAVAPTLGLHEGMPPAGLRGLLHGAFPPGARAISSAVVGGGLTSPSWFLNAGVHADYSRDDADRHLAEVAERLGYRGDGIGMLTAAPVERVREAADGGVRVWATVGIRDPLWAARRSKLGAYSRGARAAGTINVLAWIPVGLADAALVNAITTATEAKAQALFERRVPGTGTATDALCIACPQPGASPEVFCGPASCWGARLARAVHAVVTTGVDDWWARNGAAVTWAAPD